LIEILSLAANTIEIHKRFLCGVHLLYEELKNAMIIASIGFNYLVHNKDIQGNTGGYYSILYLMHLILKFWDLVFY
jgi:hypothetical protein